jgi:ABC-type transport system involved in multi-copper enzyme maturation permease subunit
VNVPRTLTRTIAYYELRLSLGLTALLPALLLPGFALLGWLTWASRGDMPRLDEIVRAFELLMPLTAGLIAAGLMSIEREAGFDELRRSTPEKSWRVPLLRLSGALSFTLSAALLAALLFAVAGGEVNLRDLLAIGLPPALVMLGLALLIGNIAGNTWAAAALVLAYWMIEFRLAGQITGALFLFQKSYPLPDVDLMHNRLLLLAFGILLLGLNLGYTGWRRRRGEGR